LHLDHPQRRARGAENLRHGIQHRTLPERPGRFISARSMFNSAEKVVAQRQQSGYLQVFTAF